MQPTSNEIVVIDAKQSEWVESLLANTRTGILHDFDCIEEAREFLSKMVARDTDPRAIVISYPSPRTSGGEPNKRLSVLMHMHVRWSRTMIVFVTPPDLEADLRRRLGDLIRENVMIYSDSKESTKNMVKLLKESLAKAVAIAK